jgi:Fuc2NAc and GlcNAc transferase
VDLALIVLGMVLTFLLTGAMRRYALSARMIDIPNARSSHTRPTPRGGGVAIVASFTLLAAWRAASGPVPLVFAGILTGALLVACVGYLDDRATLAAPWRLLAHAIASVWVLIVLGGIPPAPAFGMSFDLGWAGLALAAVYLVWMINLYNFMDGIDGIASVEAITVSVAGALCWWLATGSPLWSLPVIFAGCVAGFLGWNYPPAKIFMGDAGSGFIGMIIGAWSLWSAQQATYLFWCWFILIGCFMVDATTTLVRRTRRGEKFHEAHRSHAYQYASRKHSSHQKVSLAIGAINLAWLLPIALLVATRMLDGALGTVIAYAPLIYLAFHYKAGDRAGQEV